MAYFGYAPRRRGYQPAPRPAAPKAAPKPPPKKVLSDGEKANIARDYVHTNHTVPITFEGPEHKTHLKHNDIRLHLSDSEVRKVCYGILKGLGNMKGQALFTAGDLISNGSVRLTMTIGLKQDMSSKMLSAMQMRASARRGASAYQLPAFGVPNTFTEQEIEEVYKQELARIKIEDEEGEQS